MIDHLIEQIDSKTSPIVVGLDPLIQQIPDFIKQQALKDFGNTLQGAAEAIFIFNKALLEEIHLLVPAVKLQMACYELYGSWGIEIFYRTVKLARQFGLIVIDDSKRSDIGSSAKLYAINHLGNAPLIEGVDNTEKADFVTINPYLGSDSIDPFIDICRQHDKGLFILVRTSNPSAGDYQEALVGNMPLYQKIAEDIQVLSRNYKGSRDFSPIGAVVGATWPDETEKLRNIMPNVYFLMPGFGAQGATSDQVVTAFDKNGYGAIINSSRGIIFAYQSPRYQSQFPSQEQYAKASAQAVKNMRDELLRSLSQAGKLPGNW
ncbi:orotidine-5'-phosphate decarboxylase [bacterium]|nr:orotidine-5'-phosphate decarboxylase [bacterium]